MYIMVLEAAELYRGHVSELPKEELKTHNHTVTAMLHIHGRALQQFIEIIS